MIVTDVIMIEKLDLEEIILLIIIVFNHLRYPISKAFSLMPIIGRFLSVSVKLTAF